MKYLVLVPDGMADEKVPSLGDLTPMEKANKPTMDALIKHSFCGKVSNVPDGMVPESDTANMSIMSFDPKIYSHGRSPLEAFSMGLKMEADQTAYRTNVVTVSDEEGIPYSERTMLDHSADEISTEEADQLISALNDAFASDRLHFYTGISYRHCMLYRDGDEHYSFSRPHDIIGRKIGEYLPSRDNGGEAFLDMMEKSFEILDHHPVNEARRERGLRPANSIWFWSPGKRPELPSFKDKWGLDGTVISAVDLIKGIGLCAGMESIDVEGATGNVHTNYKGKADAAIDAFKRGRDFVYVHVEAPDECGHRAEIENKVLSVELIDRDILKPLYEYLESTGEEYKIMVLPDHPTPLAIRTHSKDPVPFFIYSSDHADDNSDCVELFSESECEKTNVYIPDGYRLLEYLTKKKPNDGTSVPEKEVKKESLISFIFDFAEIFIFSIVAVLLIFAFLFRPALVDGNSMRDTLYDNEVVLINEAFYEPKIGDIVVFHLTGTSLNKPLVKRIIATEGQTVEIDFKNAKIKVDGAVLEEDHGYFFGEQVNPFDESSAYLPYNGYMLKSGYPQEFFDRGELVYRATVPEGHVFVMGDNRNHSLDSRFGEVGFVDCRRILGRADTRVYPFNKFGKID